MPRLKVHRERGGPSFVRRGGATVSLVPEVTVYQLSLEPLLHRTFHLVRPHAVFLIDSQGVTRVRRDPERLFLPLLGVVVALALVSLVLRRSSAARTCRR